MGNMDLYNKFRTVPETAKKKIGAGRLKGMTDINPMWRIQVLTEVFGACGFGWWYEVTDKQIVKDEETKQSACFVDINLYVKDPSSGQISAPIPGTGGSAFVTKENSGMHLSDECYKMALTDAISIACKSLGVGADVWYADGRSKYTSAEEAERVVGDGICTECKQAIRDSKKKDGTPWSAADIGKYMTLRYGRAVCIDCAKKLEARK